MTIDCFESISENDVGSLFTVESDAADKKKEEVFMRLHTQIICEDGTKDEDILRELMKTPVENRILLIEGRTGTGKSHLCRFLEIGLRKQRTKLVVRIPKYRLKPHDAIEAILKSLPGYVRETVEQRLDEYQYEKSEKKFKELGDRLGSYAKIVIGRIFRQKDIDSFIPNPDDRESVSRNIEPTFFHVLRDYVDLMKGGSDEEPFAFFTRNMVDSACAEVSGEVDTDDLRSFFNEKCEEVLQEELGLPSPADILDEISNCIIDRNKPLKAKDKLRIVLIVDDLAALTVFRKVFVDYIQHLSSGVWDVILGLTPGLKSQLEYSSDIGQIAESDTIRARKKSYSLSSTEHASTFLDSTGTGDFVRRYLRVLKARYGFGGSQWDNGDACATCSRLDLCREAYGDSSLAPLNSESVGRIYDNLVEEKPREMLANIKELLVKYLEGENPSKWMESNTKWRSDIMVSEAIGCKELRDTLRWYGSKVDMDKCTILQQLADDFGIQNEDYKDLVSNGTIVAPIQAWKPPDVTGGDLGGEEETEGHFEDVMNAVHRWLEKNERPDVFEDYLRSGIITVIENLESTGVSREGIGSVRPLAHQVEVSHSLHWHRQFQGEYFPVVVEDSQATSPKYPHMIIDREYKDDVFSLVRIGIADREAAESLAMEYLASGNRNMRLIQTILTWDCEIKDHFAECMGLEGFQEYRKWTLYAVVLLRMLSYGDDLVDFQSFKNSILEGDEEYNILERAQRAASDSWIPDALIPHKLMDELFRYAPVLYDLFAAQFKPRKNSMKGAEISGLLKANVQGIVEFLASTSLQKGVGFTVASSSRSTDPEDLVNCVQRVASLLSESSASLGDLLKEFGNVTGPLMKYSKKPPKAGDLQFHLPALYDNLNQNGLKDLAGKCKIVMDSLTDTTTDDIKGLLRRIQQLDKERKHAKNTLKYLGLLKTFRDLISSEPGNSFLDLVDLMDKAASQIGAVKTAEVEKPDDLMKVMREMRLA